MCSYKLINVPPINNLDAIIACCIHNSHEMGECGLPHTQLKLVKKIWNKHAEEIETKFCESHGESILHASKKFGDEHSE